MLFLSIILLFSHFGYYFNKRLLAHNCTIVATNVKNVTVFVTI